MNKEKNYKSFAKKLINNLIKFFKILKIYKKCLILIKK